MSQINKQNINNVIIDLLKAHRIMYSIEGSDSKYICYNVQLSSFLCTISIEYDLDNPSDDIIYISFTIREDESSLYLYDDTIKYPKDFSEISDIEASLLEMMDYNKNMVKVIFEIKSKIKEILSLCEEHELDSDSFLTVEY